MSFWDFLKEPFDFHLGNQKDDCSIKLSQANLDLAGLQKQFGEVNSAKNRYAELLQDCIKSKNNLVFDNTNYITKIKKLENQLGLIKPIDKPSANITYWRPILIGKNNFKEIEIDVRLFCQPDFFIEQDLQKAGLIFDGTQNLDELIPKIYVFAKSRLPSYGSDEFYGFKEYWQFSYEIREQKLLGNYLDCDDMSDWIAANFVAAKIPVNLWLVSCGYTRGEEGHSTIYCKDSTGIWRHLNSTFSYYKYDNLKKYPSNKDDSDFMGIKPNGFWFSFNNIYSISKFESEEAKTSFKEQTLPISIKKTF